MTGRCKRRRMAMAGDRNTADARKIDNPNFNPQITEKPSDLYTITKLPLTSTCGLSFYCQARKALSFLSPYDSEESPPQPVSVSGANTLPSRVSHLLSRHSNGRKRQKKSHSGYEKKSSTPVKPGRIWAETEEYFRELTVEDVEMLERVSIVGFSGNATYFRIPYHGNDDSSCVRYNALKCVYEKDRLSLGNEIDTNNRGEDEVKKTGVVKEENVSTLMGVDGDEKMLTGFEPTKESNGLKRENGEKDFNYFSGLEWLLGSRSKIYLASEWPSKKRKLLGRDEGLEKLLVACPVEALDSACHYCSYGDMGDPLNCLIKCASCGMVVLQRCYGVIEDVDSSWLCSWCKWKNGASLSTVGPCLLCPKSGGALKPIENSKVSIEDEVNFAHLFCCQWMPEVYLENTRTTQPIMNTDQLNDTRKKLSCYLCKVKWSASVRCSNGACRTSFHPICAREARDRMEIWGKLRCDDVELRAFCSKHSGIQYNRRSRKAGTSTDDSVSHIHKEMVATVSESHKLKISQRNGDKLQIGIETADIVDSRSSSESHSENGDVLQPADKGTVDTNTENVGACSYPNFTMIMKKLIDVGKVDAKDVASEIGVSPDSLSTLLTDNDMAPELQYKLLKWLKNHADVCGLQKTLKVRIRSLASSKDNVAEGASAVSVEESDISDAVPVKCVPPRIRTKNNIRIMKGDKSCNFDDKTDNEATDDDLCPVGADSNGICTESLSDVTEKMLIDPEQYTDSSLNDSLRIEDEIEGELIYYQQRILRNAVRRKHITDDLISKVARNLPLEIDAAKRKKWDAVSVSQYNHEVREAKKKGRKERRHKEAQAGLAAAAAAAAASSRLSTRKDVLEDSADQEDLPKVNVHNVKPRVKNNVPSNIAKDRPRICQICTRSQTILNPVLVCSSCKVAVHLDCYRSVKSTSGPWHCELCEDLFSSQSSRSATNSVEKPYFVAECGLCGGTASAFRKSVDGQWIHVLCAEWVLESKYRRGQVNPIDGMETVSKGNDICSVCHCNQGVCLKCSYGHCQSTFHPTCARSAGFYMTVRSSGGKLQHKAYCEKHGSEQRAKDDTQKHGIEEFKSLKQLRVELERLRLLCERIIKREKLKRELVVCSHDILASNRDSVLSTLAHHPFYQTEVSSESATTSIKGDYSHQSGSETVQRSDDITIDSTVEGKRHIKILTSMDNDQRTVDSSTCTLKPTERVSISGKQIQRPSMAPLNLSEDAETRSNYKKHTETLGKELIMTSDQASMRHQRLPKGFVYVPIRSLSKDKKNSTVPDVSGT